MKHSLGLFFSLPLLVISGFVSPTLGQSQNPNQEAAGLVVYRRAQDVDDEFAWAVEYRKISFFPDIVNIKSTRGKAISVFPEEVRFHYPYNDLDPLLQPNQLIAIEAKIHELREAVEKYPAARPALRGRLLRLERLKRLWRKGYAQLRDGRVMKRWTKEFEREVKADQYAQRELDRKNRWSEIFASRASEDGQLLRAEAASFAGTRYEHFKATRGPSRFKPTKLDSSPPLNSRRPVGRGRRR